MPRFWAAAWSECPSRGTLIEEVSLQFFTIQTEVGGDHFQNGPESPNSQWIVARKGNVVFAVFVRCESHVRSLLSRDAITVALKCFDKIGARKVARQFYTVRTSSRTK